MGCHINIRTDHKPLVFIFIPGKELPVVVSSRLSRYAILLSIFDDFLLTTSEDPTECIDGPIPFSDMELLKAIAAIRTGDRKDVTDKAFTHKKNEFSLINGFHFWESSSCFRFKRPSWISYT
ncbi:unnamed protein product [Lepeophtheirus salmonis]|uniref:(salmon louse) hypothetical protein n=1 Tax=Lepeophtheirus salmonis TaxID=72036 RepID=A0A7R8HAV4_LEPSM|nr:unnamed protein product [Lepeophtheirus salmonis]CAF2981169.1 unnamed protein product [Lepeophtheirus salmonis]